jgi:hypothetical protein
MLFHFEAHASKCSSPAQLLECISARLGRNKGALRMLVDFSDGIKDVLREFGHPPFILADLNGTR